MGPRTWLRQHLPDDPGFAGLRRAVRAAIVVPVAFAAATRATDSVEFMIFVAFGCFALLVMADFGGPRLPRAGAYLTATLVGAVLVILGTLASPNHWLAALAMFAVGFGIQFAGVCGSYVPAAQTALLLSFVLAVSIPAQPSAIGARVGGWAIAGAVSTLAGVFLWPRFERVMLRQQAAAACRALADVIRAERAKPPPADLAQRLRAAQEAVDAVSHDYSATAKRPAGPTRRDRAFVELLAELDEVRELVARPTGHRLTDPHPCLSAGDVLAACVVRVLEGTADVLTGGQPPNLLDLQQARIAHRRALDDWAAAALHDGEPTGDVLDGLEADNVLRVVSYLTLAIGGNAVIAAGGHVDPHVPPPAGIPAREGLVGFATEVEQTLRTHLTPTSSALHNSLRVASGLGLAVLLARLLQLDHAFWVVLGTLTVLRSNAFGTGRTTVEAIAGTALGFAIGAVVMTFAGTVLWVALPIGVFLATYAASVVGFVVGQAAFTVLVIILFNLISPAGWQLGLVRLEDVAIGAGISVVVGLLLWPRGAREEFRRALAELYRDLADYLDGALDRIIDPGAPDDGERARETVVRARDRVGKAFDAFLNERGAKPLPPETGATLLAAGNHAIMAGDIVGAVAAMGYRAAGCDDGVRILREQTGVMVNRFECLARRLDGAPDAAGPPERVSGDLLRRADLDCLDRWKDDPSRGRAALAVVVAGEWIDQLGTLAGDLEQPVAAAVAAARVPWWR